MRLYCNIQRYRYSVAVICREILSLLASHHQPDRT